jgi:hypothetical protein
MFHEHRLISFYNIDVWILNRGQGDNVPWKTLEVCILASEASHINVKLTVSLPGM